MESYGLQSTIKMSSVEALAMFLWVVGAPQSVRLPEDHIVRSLETVSQTFDTVLTCVLRLAPDIIKLKDLEFSEVHSNLESPDFFATFQQLHRSNIWDSCQGCGAKEQEDSILEQAQRNLTECACSL